MNQPGSPTPALKDVTPLDLKHATALVRLAQGLDAPAGEALRTLDTRIRQHVDRGGFGREEGQQLLRTLFWHSYADPEAVLVLIGAHCESLARSSDYADRQRRTLFRLTEHVFRPVLELMGMWRLRREFGDISLLELHRRLYERALGVQAQYALRLAPIHQAVCARLQNEIGGALGDVDIRGHVSSVSSVHEWLSRGRTTGSIYRRLTFDVLVDSDEACYLLPLYIHRIWEPMSGRSKRGRSYRDLIAVSKFNGYRCLVTTVAYDNGSYDDGVSTGRSAPLEFRIRSRGIERVNLDGYVASKLGRHAAEPIRGAWWFDDGLIEYVTSRPLDSVTPELFVFSPAGKAYCNLPRDSTPIDYAYHVHTEIGNHCQRVWVDGCKADFADRLKNGQLVKIDTDPDLPGPEEAWLNYVETSTAKGQIKRAIRRRRKPRGREIIDRVLTNELTWYGFDVPPEEIQRFLEQSARNMGYLDVNALYLDIADGDLSPERIVNALTTAQLEKHIRPSDPSAVVPGSIQFARCFHNRVPCRVTPGAPIVGRIINNGRPSIALKVYRADCPNAPQGEDAIPLTWLGHRIPGDIVRITASAVDRSGLLGVILKELYRLQESASLRILGVHAGVNRDRTAEFELDVETPDMCAIDMIRSRLQELKRRGILGDYQVDPLSPIDKILLALPESLPNPYTTGPADWRIFKGRQDELNQLAHYLRGRENFIVIVGGNRIGKTSLLRYAETQIVPELNMVPIGLDMQGLPDQSEDSFWGEVASCMEKAYSRKTFNLGGESRRAGASAYAEFVQMLRDDKAYVSRPPVLLVDEVNVVDELWERGQAVLFVQHLLSFARRHPEINLVLSLQEDLYNAAAVGVNLPTGGLLDKGTRIRLGYLSEQEARRVVVDPLVTMLHYQEDAIEKIVSLTAGHPYYLQKMLARVVERASIEKTKDVTEEWLLSVLEQIYDSRHEFHDFLRKAHGFQRTVLVALADHCTSLMRGATASEIGQILGSDGVVESAEHIASALEELRLAGVIQRNDELSGGVFCIDVPLFLQWLVRNRLTLLQAGSTATEQERLYE